MIPFILSPTSPRKPANAGFAMVLALSLMAFVLVLLLSITTLVQVESRGATTQMQRLQAEQAALLGLQVALGELQKAAGPDQRVTATADVLNVSNAPNFKQPHLLGVWDSFKQSNDTNTPINYATQKSGDFVQWLNSTATVADKTNQTYPTVAPTNSVTLVGSGTLPTPDAGDPATQYVQASTVDVMGARGARTGGYAWHVFDESQKVNLTLSNSVTAANVGTVTDAQRVSALGSAGAPNFTALAQATSGNAFYMPLENLSSEEKGKTVSLVGSALLGGATTFAPREANAFHILTTDSKSLLVDVANGGFQKDLSLLFENTNLPATYASRHIYSESDTPLEPAPTRFAGAEPIPSPDPKWSLLHSHYNLYKDVSVEAGAYGIDASDVERDVATDFFDEQQLLPVVSNAQFIFSMAPQKHNLTAPYIGFLGFWVDVVVTLWNPYDVELRLDAMELEFYRFPLQVEFFRSQDNGSSWESASSGQPVHIAYMFNRGNNPTGVANIQDKLPYRARIAGPNSNPSVNDIILKPGEYKVFGAPKGTIYNHNNWNYTRGLELEEGYDPRSGGVFERYISTNELYQSLCPWPPGNRVQIQVQEGDLYAVEVSPAKVNRTTSLWPETNGEEIIAYLKIYRGDGGSQSIVSDVDAYENTLNENRRQVGAIEIDLAGIPSSWNNLPSYGKFDMSQLTVTATNNLPQGDATEKQPFLIASLRLKTEQDSASINNSSSSQWLHNGIANQYFTNGLSGDQNENEKTHQYEFTWEPMTSWNNVPTVEVDSDNRGYGGAGVTSQSGVNFAPFHQIPLVPATSIAQFSHAPLNGGGQVPLTTQVVGNSFASPSIPLGGKSNSGSLGRHLDHSYMANTTLFDGYFLSTATGETGALYGTSGRSLNVVLSQFFGGSQALSNPNFEPATNTIPTVTAADYATFAQHLYNKGAFNVNSTSEEAWALILASGTTEALPILDMLTASTTFGDAAASTDTAVSRFSPMIGDENASTPVYGQDRWAEHRRLTPNQIMTLAKNVVAEVKARGPFQSVAEFVNRQLVSSAATGNSGALQTAIENSALNTNFGKPAPKNNSELGLSGTGNTSDGAASQITQADLLNRLAPSLTVRGDTFRIRAYGEVADIRGQPTKAWCEAVVQRQHDFVDDTNLPTTIDSALSTTNQVFGRRFKIVSFRWLSADEV